MDSFVVSSLNRAPRIIGRGTAREATARAAMIFTELLRQEQYEMQREGASSALKLELELMLAAAMALWVDPHASSEDNYHLSFASIFFEGSRQGDEQAPDERVAFWLRETLVETLVGKRSAPSIAGSVGSGSLSWGSTRPRSHSKEYTRSTSLWVLPEAMAMALTGELFKEPLTISDSARAEALACLGRWD